MMTEQKQLQVRLRTAEIHLDIAVNHRDSLPFGTPAHDEWNGIVFACLREARQTRSALDRLRQAQECGR